MRTYGIVLIEDDDTYLATCPSLPEVTTFGATKEEACAQAMHAIEEALAARMAVGEDIPPARWRKNEVPVAIPLQTQLKVELYQALRGQGKTRADLQRLLAVHRPTVDRLFDLNHASRLDQLEAAFRALGREIDIEIKETAA